MNRRPTFIACAVTAALAVPFAAAAQDTTLHQYPQASGNTSQIAPEDAHFPGGVRYDNDSARSAKERQSQAQKSQRSMSQQGQSQQQGQGQQQAQGDKPELVIVTIEPVSPRMSYRQRAESTFRALDMDGDGEISMGEAGVNTQLLNAFQKLDRNSNRTIDRQEFAGVHVNDGKRGSQQSSQQASSKEQSASAASGGSAAQSGGTLPSRSIEERSRFTPPGDSVPQVGNGQSRR